MKPLYCLFLGYLLASASSYAAPITFSDRTAEAGVEFTHSETPDHQAGPMAGGGAVGDFNGDGYPDFFVLGGGGRSDGLFINNRDGTFTDQAALWEIDQPHRGVGATVGDYDGDGDDDIYLTSFGASDEFATHGKHRLYRNEGSHFVNVAEEAGVAVTTATHPDGYGASFGDYDRDGDLDLFVGAWHAAPVLGARLFQNQGDGTFINATPKAQIITESTRAFGAVWADMDGDFYPELLVAGDFGSNRYYKNQRDGSFVELDPGTGTSSTEGAPPWTINNAFNAMGTTVGDFNRDGLQDWFITAIWPTAAWASDYWGNGLYINQGNNVFAEVAQSAGVNDGGWGWGTEAIDFNNDGWTDLVMTNGWPFDDNVTGASFANERSYIWRNRGDLSFEEVGESAGLTHQGEGRTLLTLDYDRDGDMDIVILSYREAVQIFRNDLIQNNSRPADANWLQVVIDTKDHPELAAHGAGGVITIETDLFTQTQQVTMGGTFLGQSELVAHFGLGESTRIKRLTVDWGEGIAYNRSQVRMNSRTSVQMYVKPQPKIHVRTPPKFRKTTR